jgi:hypothetical protein
VLTVYLGDDIMLNENNITLHPGQLVKANGEENPRTDRSFGCGVACPRSITERLMGFYLKKGSEVKANIDQLGAKVNQQCDHVKLINDVLSDIEDFMNYKDTLDLTSKQELQEKLRVIKDCGAKVPDKLQLTPQDQERLIKTLNRKVEEMLRMNTKYSQEMDFLIKELDRLLMLLHEAEKTEGRAIKASAAAVK